MKLTARGESDERLSRIFKILYQAYPKAHIVLNYANPWELLVSVILSAQCTDIMVNKVTAKLFTKYKNLDEYVNADIKEFETDIRSTGFYHNKAKNILAAAKLIKTKFKGKVPETMEEILTLPGVARKTANVVLGNAFGVVEGIAVDTHVHRLSQRLRLVDLSKIGGKKTLYFGRLGLLKSSRPSLGATIVDYKKDADPVKIEKELMQTFPKSDWFKLTYLLIDHGRAVCKAQKPDCKTCFLNKLCPAARV